MEEQFNATLNGMSLEALMDMHRNYMKKYCHIIYCPNCNTTYTPTELYRIAVKLETIETKMLQRIDVGHIWQMEKLHRDLNLPI
jgi:hypothetical protein